MNLILSTALFVSGSGSHGNFIHSILFLIIAGMVLGLFLVLVPRIPFIPEIFKQVLTWIIYLVAVLILVNFLLGLIGLEFIQIS